MRLMGISMMWPIRTFKVGLPAKHDLRKSLTRKSISSVRQLMNCINEYKQVEEDQ